MPAIVIQGDLAIFDQAFGPATVVARPGTMIASGRPKAGAAVCVLGDEKKVIVAGCPYTTSVHSIPGVGTLTITALAGSQQASKVKSDGKPVILADGKFTAQFQVTAPAQQPSAPNPIPDATPIYSGQGEFQGQNKRAEAT